MFHELENRKQKDKEGPASAGAMPTLFKQFHPCSLVHPITPDKLQAPQSLLAG